MAAAIVLACAVRVRANVGDAPTNAPIELAITLDDLPRPQHLEASAAAQSVISRLSAALRAHGVPPVIGFANAGALARHPEDREALLAWLRDGQRLGNHGFGHLDARRVSVSEYSADVVRNERALDSLAKRAGLHAPARLFRYPYLQEGATLESRRAIRHFLGVRGYRIAPVTVDFHDWAYFGPAQRCTLRAHETGLHALREAYLTAGRTALLDSVAQAQALYGRPVRHILLLHAGEFTAALLDSLLREYEALGVRFISLERALDDPAYANPPEVVREYGMPFLTQVALERGIASPAAPAASSDSLELLCASAPSRWAGASGPGPR